MRSLILLFVLVSLTNIYAQKEIDISIVYKNSTDVINTKAIVYTNMFNDKLINELSFHKKIITVSNGDKVKIREDELRYLKFTDFQGKERRFISDSFTESLNPNGYLFEVMLEGKISWYRNYEPHYYDGSVVEIDYFCKKNEKSIRRLGVARTKRKTLFQITNDRPDLVESIKKLKNDDDILMILSDYNRKATANNQSFWPVAN